MRAAFLAQSVPLAQWRADLLGFVAKELADESIGGGANCSKKIVAAKGGHSTDEDMIIGAVALEDAVL